MLQLFWSFEITGSSPIWLLRKSLGWASCLVEQCSLFYRTFTLELVQQWTYIQPPPFYSHFTPRFIMLWRIVAACVINEAQIESQQLSIFTINTISPVKVVVYISYRELTPEQFQLIYNITHRRPLFGPWPT